MRELVELQTNSRFFIFTLIEFDKASKIKNEITVNYCRSFFI